jgi:twitching motility protein PilT
VNPLEQLDFWLAELLERHGSDLHLKAQAIPRIRVNGDLSVLGTQSVSPEETMSIARYSMGEELWAGFVRRHEADYAYRRSGLGRFRVNAFLQRGSVSMVFRAVSTNPPTIEELGLPESIRTLANEHRGLILVTGPTGSGKSSTLAAMVNHINATRSAHIVTIEDPLETLHQDKMSIVNQREIGFDTHDYSTAMRAAMRQDPDVILVGEMRDLETVTAAIQAAETGHLVLSTLHTTGAAETILRVVDFFPPHLQQQIRVSLAGILKGVVCQRLVRTKDGLSRVPALEVMVANGRTMQCVVDPLKTYDLREIIKEGAFYGMMSFDQSLKALYLGGVISLEDAMENATNPHDLKLAIGETEEMAPL